MSPRAEMAAMMNKDAPAAMKQVYRKGSDPIGFIDVLPGDGEPKGGSHIHEGGGNTWMCDVYVWVRFKEKPASQPFECVNLTSESFGHKTREAAKAWIDAELVRLLAARDLILGCWS